MKNFQFAVIFLSLMLVACGGTKGDPENGRMLFEQKMIGSKDAPGCTTCHSVQAEEVVVGPSLFEVTKQAQRTIESALYTGSATSVDEYLRESIITPNVHVGAGFIPDIMYSKFADELTEEQIDDLIAYMATL